MELWPTELRVKIASFLPRKWWYLQHKIKHPDFIAAVALNPNNTILATGEGANTAAGHVKLWNLRTGKLLRKFTEIKGPNQIEFSPNGKLMLAGADDVMQLCGS